jgi:hypothetical protein
LLEDRAIEGVYRARDTVRIEVDPASDAADCLAGLAWEPSAFEVTLQAMPDVVNGRRTIPACWSVSFPSPRPSGVAVNDRVDCELYLARDEATGTVLRRPAVIVVHESGSRMQVGRMIATELARRGLHAFMVQLPGYGSRRSIGVEQREIELVDVFKQGIADVRRARDAAIALPFVDGRHIALQGTSLGGFVATVTAGLDEGFDCVYLLLCGGDLHRVLTEGGRDAAKALERLQSRGVGQESVKDLLWPIEPLRVAHRLDPSRTWLYSARFDEVVPPELSKQLAEAIGLNSLHHRDLLATHYSGVMFLPGVLHRICENAERVTADP